MADKARNYSDKEFIAIMEKTGAAKHLTIMQLLSLILYWHFKKSRVNSFANGLEKGKSVYFAWKDSKTQSNDLHTQ